MVFIIIISNNCFCILININREFFFLLSHEMFNPDYSLFQYSHENSYTLKINPQSGINPEHLYYFKFIGRVVGMAIFHDQFLDISFTVPLYKGLLNKKPNFNDLESDDPTLYKNFKWLLYVKLSLIYIYYVKYSSILIFFINYYCQENNIN